MLVPHGSWKTCLSVVLPRSVCCPTEDERPNRRCVACPALYDQQSEVKNAAKSGELRGAFRLVGFWGPTHVLQMRHMRKRANKKEGWGQVSCCSVLSSSALVALRLGGPVDLMDD